MDLTAAPSSVSYSAMPQPETSSDELAEQMKRERALNHVAEAMMSIPLEEKQAYLEALETAPEVMQQESDPMLFVRVCNDDFWAAAKRCKHATGHHQYLLHAMNVGFDSRYSFWFFVLFVASVPLLE